jgi:hypothetical protein
MATSTSCNQLCFIAFSSMQCMMDIPHASAASGRAEQPAAAALDVADLLEVILGWT